MKITAKAENSHAAILPSQITEKGDLDDHFDISGEVNGYEYTYKFAHNNNHGMLAVEVEATKDGKTGSNRHDWLEGFKTQGHVDAQNAAEAVNITPLGDKHKTVLPSSITNETELKEYFKIDGKVEGYEYKYTFTHKDGDGKLSVTIEASKDGKTGSKLHEDLNGFKTTAHVELKKIADAVQIQSKSTPKHDHILPKDFSADQLGTYFDITKNEDSTITYTYEITKQNNEDGSLEVIVVARKNNIEVRSEAKRLDGFHKQSVYQEI